MSESVAAAQQLAPWIPLAVAACSGGAAGALITAIVNAHKARVQPVHYRLNRMPLFEGAKGAGTITIQAKSPEGEMTTLENLDTLELELVNRSNNDRADFKFGITLPRNHHAILAEYETDDRHHEFVIKPELSATEPKSELDFVISPFNRGDHYLVRLYVTEPWSPRSGEEATISSPEPVLFTKLPSPSDLSVEISPSIALFSLLKATVPGINMKVRGRDLF